MAQIILQRIVSTRELPRLRCDPSALMATTNAPSVLIKETSVIVIQSAGDGRRSTFVEHFIATPGQTVFPLETQPAQPDEGKLTVNGIEQKYGEDYTISTSNLVWISPDFSLDGEHLIYHYWQ